MLAVLMILQDRLRKTGRVPGARELWLQGGWSPRRQHQQRDPGGPELPWASEAVQGQRDLTYVQAVALTPTLMHLRATF